MANKSQQELDEERESFLEYARHRNEQYKQAVSEWYSKRNDDLNNYRALAPYPAGIATPRGTQLERSRESISQAYYAPITNDDLALVAKMLNDPTTSPYVYRMLNAPMGPRRQLFNNAKGFTPALHDSLESWLTRSTVPQSAINRTEFRPTIQPNVHGYYAFGMEGAPDTVYLSPASKNTLRSTVVHEMQHGASLRAFPEARDSHMINEAISFSTANKGLKFNHPILDIMKAMLGYR